ncbi:hypothetical protein NUSPORA_02317 [Nucleospora cyclopteri]
MLAFITLARCFSYGILNPRTNLLGNITNKSWINTKAYLSGKEMNKTFLIEDQPSSKLKGEDLKVSSIFEELY